jgi:hypothetical protein
MTTQFSKLIPRFISHTFLCDYVMFAQVETFGHGLHLQMTLKGYQRIIPQSELKTTAPQSQYTNVVITTHFGPKHTLSFLVNSVQNSPLAYGPKVHQHYP